MKIKFLKPHKVQQGDGQGPRYSVGEEVSFDGPVAEGGSPKARSV